MLYISGLSPSIDNKDFTRVTDTELRRLFQTGKFSYDNDSLVFVTNPNLTVDAINISEIESRRHSGATVYRTRGLIVPSNDLIIRIADIRQLIEFPYIHSANLILDQCVSAPKQNVLYLYSNTSVSQITSQLIRVVPTNPVNLASILNTAESERKQNIAVFDCLRGKMSQQLIAYLNNLSFPLPSSIITTSDEDCQFAIISSPNIVRHDISLSDIPMLPGTLKLNMRAVSRAESPPVIITPAAVAHQVVAISHSAAAAAAVDVSARVSQTVASTQIVRKNGNIHQSSQPPRITLNNHR